jgi:glutamate 5-kinase
MQRQRIVVKLGTSTLTVDTPRLNRQRMLEIVQQCAQLHQQGHEIIIVSSGAQAAGRERLKFPDFGRTVPAKQMLSAVGQSQLMRLYSELFDIFNIVVGQVLFTRDDLSQRARYINARDTLETLLDHHIIPIINENDTIATSEIRVGDNDNLSAMTASILEANLLIILTDQPGIYTADPRQNADAKLIDRITRIDDAAYKLAGGAGSQTGTGGMVTKIEAAHTASRSGVATVIAFGGEPNAILRIVNGEQIGTRIEPVNTILESKKRWILTDRVQGSLHVDEGAARMLIKGGASLLPVGVTKVEQVFDRGATLAIVAPNGAEIAHGLSNYASSELTQICGVKSSRIVEILGYSYGDHAIHRNNMVILV